MKKVITLVLALILTVSAAVGGTVAYLTSEDSDVNVMTVGNVKIEQHQYQRKDGAAHFNTKQDALKKGDLIEAKQGEKLYPAYPLTDDAYEAEQSNLLYWGEYVTGAGAGNGLWNDEKLVGVMDKFVFVENTGKSDAYYRTIIAYECPEGIVYDLENHAEADIIVNQNGHTRFSYTVVGRTTIEGTQYLLVECLYNEVLVSGEISRPSLLQLVMKGHVTNEQVELLGDTYEVLVVTQACQTTNFPSAAIALDVSFGNITTESHPWSDNAPVFPALVDSESELLAATNAGKDIYLTANVEHQGSVCAYGIADIKVNGTTLDGNGNTLNVTKPAQPNGGGKYDYTAVSTTGGTIKNLTINEGFRAIFMEYSTKDVYIDNCYVGGDEVCYAINTGANDGNYSLYVTNSSINGWSSFSNIKSAEFTNCDFGQGTYYTSSSGRLVKPYVNTTFTDCTFVGEFYLDLSSLGEDCQVILENCTVNGVLITADNCETENLETGSMFDVELPAGRTLADCVIFR